MGFAIRRSRDLGTTSPLPTGVINPFAGTTAPTGWLLCAGQEVEIASYGDLYGVLGTTYGALTNGSGGAGSTHFRVPDLRGRIPAGKDDMGGTAASRLTSGGSGITGTTLGATGGTETHTLTSAQMPSHTHVQDAHTHIQNAHNHSEILADGVLQIGSDESSASSIRSKHVRNAADTTGAKWSTNSATPTNQNTTATNQNTGGGNAHQNTQPTLILNYIIKA